MILVTDRELDPAGLLGMFSAEQASAGAIVSFVGQVRGGDVQALELDYHPSFTRKVVERIAADARARFAIKDCAVVHRHGRLLPGDPIVFVAAAAEHRRAAFDAVDYLMDRLKMEAPFWKREHRKDGMHWIEARESDTTDHRRWAIDHVD